MDNIIVENNIMKQFWELLISHDHLCEGRKKME